MENLSSKERILRTVAGEPVDRIPIRSPIPWHPLSPRPEPGDWKAMPNFQRLVPLVAENCDFLVPLMIPDRMSGSDPLARPGAYDFSGGLFDRRFLLIPRERIEGTEEPTADGGRIVTYRIQTPRGHLTAMFSVAIEFETTWHIAPLVKDVDDAHRLLAVPYRFDVPDLSSYFADAERLGDRGVGVCMVSSPMVMVSELMGLQRLLEWTVTERPLVERLIETAYERVAQRLQYVLAAGIGPVFNFGGCEQATPPMMSKRFFDDFVLKYEGRLWRMVRDAGQIVWVHCHGKVSTVLDDFVRGGVQMLDPVEPPPQGDIEIGEAKRRAADGPMTLIGNVEVDDLARRGPDEIEALVKRAVSEGGRKHLMLGTSSDVYAQVDDRTRDNIVRFIEAGVRYGTFGGDNGCTGGP